jgi:hypothetical protein
VGLAKPIQVALQANVPDARLPWLVVNMCCHGGNYIYLLYTLLVNSSL